jgi:hypothetical protein
VILSIHTSIPSIKLSLGEAVKVEKVGLIFLTTSIESVMVVLLRVLMIMLANPTKVVMMIARDRIPPVRVLYYNSSSYLNN